MSVDLTDLRINGDSIMPMDFGGLMTSALGGPTDRIARLGSRYMAEISTPAMRIEPDGRRWAARLLRARRDGGIISIHQPGLKIGSPGTPVVATLTSSGRSIPISGLTPRYAIREGQWLNYYDADGQRYADQVQAEVIANGSGVATVTIQELLRVPIAAASVIELAAPCIEGWIEGDFSIQRTVDYVARFSFTVSEKA